jgi:hypothetical protein
MKQNLPNTQQAIGMLRLTDLLLSTAAYDKQIHIILPRSHYGRSESHDGSAWASKGER